MLSQFALFENLRCPLFFALVSPYASDENWKYVMFETVPSRTKCSLFVTQSEPLQHTIKPTYISPLWLGCKFGEGVTKGTTEQQIQEKKAALTKRIWEAFEARTVTDASGTALCYYKSWKYNDFAFNYKALLSKKDGNCDSWAEYFNDVLRIQGIQSNVETIEVDRKTTGNGMYLFLMKDWKQVGEAQKKYFNELDRGSSFGSELFDLRMSISEGKWKYNLAGNPEVKYNGGLGQNNQNPMATFQEHKVVRIGNDIYDPSYGRIYRADRGVNDTEAIRSALKNFQATAFGFFKVYAAPNGVRYNGVLRVPPKSWAMEIDAVDSDKLQFKLK